MSPFRTPQENFTYESPGSIKFLVVTALLPFGCPDMISLLLVVWRKTRWWAEMGFAIRLLQSSGRGRGQKEVAVLVDG